MEDSIAVFDSFSSHFFSVDGGQTFHIHKYGQECTTAS